ncbi:MAG TPA: hypothetical protein VEJ63_03630 [Planctomycetota bacterium]|nr:hypothetical protein [Planctomycetota bacterium]
MSDKPRRFWQIHLSTAIVLMLSGGLIVYANMPQTTTSIDSSGYVLYARGGGWPKTMYLALRWQSPPEGWPAFEYSAIAVNVASGAAMLGLIAFVCEYYTRNRTGQ